MLLGTVNGKEYEEHDKCKPEDFVNQTSTDCKDLQMDTACMFYKYGPTNETLVMQVPYNWFLFKNLIIRLKNFVISNSL